MVIIPPLFYQFPRVPRGIRFSDFPFSNLEPSIADRRRWKVHTNPVNLKLYKHLPKSNQTQTKLRRILLESGIALTQAQTVWDPRAWFAVFRYAIDFYDTAPTLNLTESVIEKVAHLKRACSEEVATGITTYFMYNNLGVRHIADVGPLMGVYLSYRGTTQEEPDFIGLRRDGKAILVESKGTTLNKRSTIQKSINKGKKQVQNIKNYKKKHFVFNKQNSGFVIATEFCVKNHSPQKDTKTIIADPDINEGASKPESPDGMDYLIRYSYSKFFRFLAQDILADYVLLGIPFDVKSEIERQYHYLEFINNWPRKLFRENDLIPIGITPFGDLVGIHARILEILATNKNSLFEPIEEILNGFDESRNKLEINGFTFPNGIVVCFNSGDF